MTTTTTLTPGGMSVGGAPLAPTGRFGAQELEHHLGPMFNGVPEDHQNAAFGYWARNAAGENEWRLTYARRVGDAWSLGVTFGKDAGAAGWSGGVKFEGSW